MSQFPIPDWASDSDEAHFSDPATIKSRAAKFERTIKRRNLIESAAGALCFAGFGALTWKAAQEGEFVIANAYAFCIACVAVVLWQLAARGSYEPQRPEESCLAHLREQYQRQYEALRGVPQWYLGPIALGITAVYTAMMIKFTEVGGLAKALEGTWVPIAGTAAFFAFVWWLNWTAARGLKKRIEQIDALD